MLSVVIPILNRHIFLRIAAGLLSLGLFPLSLFPLGLLPLGLFQVPLNLVHESLLPLGLLLPILLLLSLFLLSLLTLRLYPLSVLPANLLPKLFLAGLLVLHRAASPFIERLFIYVTGALALQAAYPPLAWSLHIGGLGRDFPAPVADVACVAIHEADIMPQSPMLHEMRFAEWVQSLGAISHSKLSATLIGAVHLIGVVSVHPPKRYREMPTAARTGDQVASTCHVFSLPCFRRS